MTCHDAHHLLARAADDPSFADAALDAHLTACDACRAALDDQRAVAALLQARPAATPSAGFVARVAARIDGRHADAGMLGLANWPVWGASLAPVAAALTLAAWLGVGLGNGAANGQDTPAAAETFSAWAQSANDEQVSLFLQPGTPTDVLLESVLTGAVPEGAGDGDVR
jgi:predicted anti-sigma-YlaC factor YlaD